MKRVLLLTAAGMLFFAGAFMFAPAQVAHADAADDEAINAVSDAVNELLALISESEGLPNEEFFPAFADKVDETRKVVSRAYADMGQTTEYGEGEVAVQGIRAALTEMKKQLVELEAAARAGDADKFDQINTAFSSSVDDYNRAVNDYGKAPSLAEQESKAGTAFLFALLAIAIALPVVLVRQNKRYKQLVAGASVKDNAILALTPRQFIVLNLVTFGMYSMYWAWQQWELVAKIEGKKYHNTVRAWLMLITSFWLFPRLLALAKAEGYKKSYNSNLLAAALLAITLASSVMWYVSDNFALLVATLVVELVAAAIVMLPVVAAQRHCVLQSKKQLLPAGRGFAVLTLAVIAIAMTLYSLYTVAIGYTG